MEADWGEIRTDLAMEAHELATQRRGGMIPGVTSEDEEKGPARISRVTIQTEEAGRALGKLPGYYVTVEAPALRGRDKDQLDEVGKILADEIQNYLRKMQIGEADSALVVGLGNWNVTPDALGPKVVELVLVTRHLWSISRRKRGGLRPVCAISRGVGITAWRPAKSWPESSKRSARVFSWLSTLWLHAMSTGWGLWSNWRIPVLTPGRELATNGWGLPPPRWEYL